MSASYVPPPVEVGVLTDPGIIASPLDTLDSQAFLKLFVAQLRFQNPMEPASGTEMMLQTAQFTQVEMLTQILNAQQASIGMAELTTASSLIGQQVTANQEGIGEVTGLVDGFHASPDGPVLHVDGLDVPLANVLSVGAPRANAGDQPAAPGTATT